MYVLMSCKSLLFVCLVLLSLWLCASSGNDEFFTNSWAVEVTGGRSVADEVARRHGFLNMGQVGSLEDTYHFIHAFSPSRSKRALDSPHLSLIADSQVVFAEQQIAKKRVKRDYSSPTDAMWSRQWYLHRSNHHDMNVERAWEQGVTGKGVVISILDDGIEHTHPDLKANYDPMASYDFNAHDEDPFPRYDPTNENKHGTRCAGEVAANRDGRCGTGAAYQARIGGVRMLDGSVTDVVESSSLHLNPQHIDIYSSSWGPSDNGQTVDGPGRLAKKAFRDGITKGRDGLGSIFVWAAGNGGREGDSCNCDGYAVSPYTISIGAVSQNDQFPWYAEVCSSTLSATYSSGSGAEKQIVSTDLHHRCTERHTGTSASAPLAAGIMALALETNRNLTWRDMQYLIIYASNPSLPSDGDFKSNGVGLKVSRKYGFGILDGAAIVNRARWWITAPPQENCSFSVDVNHIKHATSSAALDVTIDASSCAITYLEHVQAVTTLKLKKGHRKSIEISLRSPMGTKSTLLPHRRRDLHGDGFHDWPFMTVHTWGEDPRGNWKFTVSVDSKDTEASLEKLTLVLFGTKETPRSVRNVPESCHSECLEGCAGSGAQFCDTCKNFQMESSFECVSTCPTGTYQDHHMCRPCPHLCSHCNKESCLQCDESAVVLSSGECSSSCEPFTFLSSNRSCQPCHHSCLECDGPNEASCTLCPPQFILGSDGRCSVPPSCQSGEYFDSRSLECRQCHESCAECVGKGAKECTGCYPGFVLEEDDVCSVDSSSRQCAAGEFYDEGEEKCKPCSPNCTRCTDDITCLSCDSGHFLWEERIGESQLEITACIDHCPKGFHGDVATSSCQSCPSYCTACASHDACTECTLDFATPRNGQCPQPCHNGEYFDFETLHCLPCIENCLTCRNPDTCLTCQSSFYLIADTSCVSVCPEHLVEDMDKHICWSEVCHETCLTCFGEEPDQCLSCHDNAKLLEHSCVEECPSHTYYDKASSTCNHCHDSCRSCAGPSQDNCLRCPDGAFLNHFSCTSSCPDGTFVLNNTECVSCPANCVECSSPEKCLKCKDSFLRETERCVETCHEGFVADESECVPCPSGCRQCSHPNTCDICDEDRLYYKPERSCRKSCPAGYYPYRGSCAECPNNCSECTGHDRLQCTLCSGDSAMEEKTHTCTLCCNPDFPDRIPCCDCDVDRTVCALLTRLPTVSTSGSSSSSSHRIGLTITICIVVLITVVMFGIGIYYTVTRLRWRNGTAYKPLRNPKNGELAATLALVEDSESGSDAELFAQTLDT